MKPGRVRHAADLSRWSFREGDPGVSVFQNSPNDEVVSGADRHSADGKKSRKSLIKGDKRWGHAHGGA